MTDYKKLVAALRHCSHDGLVKCNECKYGGKEWPIGCEEEMMRDAAAAIEALQAEVERLKDCNEELREQQTFIDHYGNEWMTSAKDVPTSAYQHGYADGFAEARAKMDGQIITPCRGCSDYDGYGGCKSKGGCVRAKMEAQDGK